MDSNYKYAQPHTRCPCARMRNVCIDHYEHALVMSKTAKFWLFLWSFPEPTIVRVGSGVENAVFPRNARIHTNKDRGCLILVVKCNTRHSKSIALTDKKLC